MSAPRPDDAHTLDELIAALRALKVWAGNPSLRQMEKLSGLARSTLADALSPKRKTAPALEVFQGLLKAFQVADAEPWIAAWRRVQAEPARVSGSAVVPRQLPAVVPGFSGRAKAFKELTALLEGGSRLAVVCGIPGVGKTALAVQWAHQVANRFPDGQVYLDLRGYSSGPPVTPDQALALAIRAFGVPGEDIPLQQDAMVGLYRSITSDKRVLVMVDNAPSAAHVRPLVPGGPGCMTVVTSRDRLAGLVARDGAHRLELGVLTPEEAPAVVISVLGAERVLREEHAVEELVRLCGCLPLALRITAANLADRPHQTIAELMAELTAGDRLTALEVEGDEDAAVRTAFDHSYAALDPLAQKLFRRMGVAPGPELPARAAAALLDGPGAEAALRTLVAAHLVEVKSAGRYGLHDLLRLYARERCAAEESGAEALGRLYEQYLDMAVAAARAVRPDFSVLATITPKHAFAGATEALQWFDTERATLVTTIEQAGAPMAWLLTDALRGCYWLRRHTAEWLAVAKVGLAAAEQREDASACAAMHLSLGTAHWGTGDYRAAAGHFEHAVEFSRAAGDRFREFSTLGNLGGVYAELGSLEDAVGCFRRELAYYTETGDTARRARALGNLGQTEMRLGRLIEAADDLRAAVELREEIGEARLAANSLGALGVVHRYLGDLDQAAGFLERARQLNHDHEDRVSEAAALDDLARVHRDAGRRDDALHCAEEALSLAKGSGRVEIDALITVAAIRGRRDDLRRAWRMAVAIGYGHGVADALVELAWLDLAAGDVEAALRDASQGCERAAETGQSIMAGLALVALTRAHEANGDLVAAEETGRRATEVLEGAGYRGVRDRPNSL
ncbi:tetratricopeptide repeat protein [Lentzea sp. PSKA42]|uniref:Tetratricopeptide repeat protein n=1 Tax=Lentzea indica TaxID=2604800 RepID=A0ABX1FX03_9PSEU|nr:tetratricopeptide repeat protein [Lentzea indica]NKE63565.1 tetratricopeptide repeat protein [Lentzea indica]